MAQIFEEIFFSSGSTAGKIAPGRGGLVTSFTVSKTEILYLDRETFQDELKNVRGGIPLLFPNAGPLSGSSYQLPQHGFARRRSWQIKGWKADTLTLQLLADDETREKYPFDFEMNLKVTIRPGSLTHSMIITNNSRERMPTAYGTHPYFKIPQTDKALLRANIPGFNPETTDWLKPFDASFANPGLINIKMPGKEITLDSNADIFHYARIWHLPGTDFICIEPWTRDVFALDNPEQSLWIQPQESMLFQIVLSAKITK
jgi:galactose mutarotase-like enzyme